jgi:hypothetical protein
MTVWDEIFGQNSSGKISILHFMFRTRIDAGFYFILCETPGVDVMITIFCEFPQFLAKNWRFSQKPML